MSSSIGSPQSPSIPCGTIVHYSVARTSIHGTYSSSKRLRCAFDFLVFLFLFLVLVVVVVVVVVAAAALVLFDVWNLSCLAVCVVDMFSLPQEESEESGIWSPRLGDFGLAVELQGEELQGTEAGAAGGH